MFCFIFMSLLWSRRRDWFSIIAMPLLHIQVSPPPLSSKVTMFLVKFLCREHSMKATYRDRFIFLPASLRVPCRRAVPMFRVASARILGGRAWASRAEIHAYPGLPGGGMPFCMNNGKEIWFSVRKAWRKPDGANETELRWKKRREEGFWTLGWRGFGELPEGISNYFLCIFSPHLPV